MPTKAWLRSMFFATKSTFDRRLVDQLSSAPDDNRDDVEIPALLAAPKEPEVIKSAIERAKVFATASFLALAAVVTVLWVAFICWGLTSLIGSAL
jgi:hypothetical protein